MQVSYIVPKFEGSNLAYHDQNRSGFQHYFAERLSQENGIRGNVLDVGCGPSLHPRLQPLKNLWQSLDGLDPNEEEVEMHPDLRQRWAATLEEAPIPNNAYDLAYSFNVAEHVSNPAEFLAKVLSVLKPGGVYWALSNHTLHPFARIVRLIESFQLKRTYAANTSAKVNDYPAFYRCNSVRQILKNCPPAGVRKIDFHFYPCMQWDTYFPKWLRPIPHLYDYTIGTRYARGMMIFMVRIEKE
ncbi:MAG: class I SAM-dependent methyltransferase [bacterium]|nr:class I SAM-dependent methyltransferase [bacterium]